MKTKLYKVGGLIYRIKTKTGDMVFGQGITDEQFITFKRIFRKYRKELNKHPNQ